MIDSSVSPASPALAASAIAQSPRAGTGIPAAARILIVDEEATVRRTLARVLRACGYDVLECESGRAALALLQHDRFAILLCEVRTPAPSELEVIARALELDPHLAVLVLSAVDEAAVAREALARGALDYLVKPVGLGDLQHAIERALRRRRLELDRRHVERQIREEIVLRTMELEREKATLHGLTIGIAETLINAMEVKDVYLRGHSHRVAELAASVAEEMGLDADLVENVRLAGRLHDIGKIGIREDVLNKPGALTPEEFAHVQEHVGIGVKILEPLRHIPVVLEFIHDHHEHFDGGGYPRGRAGSEISIGGRILAACDAFDAMTSRRAFRDAFDEQATIGHLEADVGRRLDPEVFAALRRVVVRRKTLSFIDDLHS